MPQALCRIGRALLFLALLLPTALRAQQSRVVSGVVVDAQSGAPVADVLVTIQGTQLRAVTDSAGGFRIAGVPEGRRPLVLKHVAYGEHGYPIMVDASASLDFRIRISSRAIALAPVTVNVVSPAEIERRASGNSVTSIDRPRIEEFTRRGGATVARLLQELPGIHLDDTCVEYRLHANNAGVENTGAAETDLNGHYNGIACQQVAVYIDGIWTQQGAEAMQVLALQDLEHVEVLSPSEAGVRYPGGQHGVILIQTRKGTAQSDDHPITITGFAWREPQPYRWARVLGASAVADAATVGLVYKAFDCGPGDEPELARSAMCTAPGSVGTALFTAGISGLVTRWAGGTSYSKGRSTPATVLGTVTASIGYWLRAAGENRDSDAVRWAGRAVLAVGVPIALTFSDRVFRVLR